MRIYLCSLLVDEVIVVDKGPIRIVTINHPESRNCVITQTATELYRAFTEFEQDPSVLVGILAGKGEILCAGYDLKELLMIRSHIKLYKGYQY